MGVRRYTTRLLGLVCLLGDLGGEGGGEGGVPSFGCEEGGVWVREWAQELEGVSE